MNASRADLVRLALEALLALILIAALLLGNQGAQAGSLPVSSNPAPPGSAIPLAVQAPQDDPSTAALMAAEMAALTPPIYFTNLPVINR